VKRTGRIVTTLCATVSAAGLLGGCVAGTANANHNGIPASPELDTVANGPDRNFTKLNIYSDLGRRMFLEDLASAIHADRPTRLADRPIPY